MNSHVSATVDNVQMRDDQKESQLTQSIGAIKQEVVHLVSATTASSSSSSSQQGSENRGTASNHGTGPQKDGAIAADAKPLGNNNNDKNGNARNGSNPQYLTIIGRRAPVAPHTLSSQVASALSTAALYPIDVVKTRIMSQDGTEHRRHNGRMYTSIYSAMRIIVKEEGLRTLYRGCHVAVFGAVVSWGLYMFLYRELCNLTAIDSWIGRTGVSMLSSLIASFLSSPIWLVKSRMQLEERTLTSNYSSFSRGIMHAIRSNGVRSLWRGVSLQMILVFPNAMVLPTYDTLKGIILRQDPTGKRTELAASEVFVCTSAAKLFVMILSHPVSTVKLRLQDVKSNHGSIRYENVRNTIATVWKREGTRGLYRGFGTGLVHSLPRSVLQYYLYERLLNFFIRHQQHQDQHV